MRDNNSGDSNIIVNGNNNVVGDINQNKTKKIDDHGRIIIDSKRDFVVPIGSYSNWIIFCSISVFISLLSFAGNFASIFSFIGIGVNDVPPSLRFLCLVLFPIFCFIGLLAYKVGVRRSAVGLPGSLSLEGGVHGKIFLTRLVAICPFCGSHMTKLPASEHVEDHTLVCKRNPRHRAEFDMTTLPELEV